MSKILGRAVSDITVSEEYPEEPIIAGGTHMAMITNISEVQKDNGEEYVKVVFQLVGGAHDGAKVADWWRYNSDTQSEISEKKFKTLLTLCNVQGALISYDQVYMIPVGINNKPYKAQDGTLRNSFNYYRRAPAPAVTASAPTPFANQQNPIPQAVPQSVPQAVPQAVPQPVMQAAPQVAPSPIPTPNQPPPAPSIPTMPVGGVPQAYANPPPAAPDIGDGENVPF